MMSIGEFAELTGLSLKALRLYDEQGLLKPARTDPWSRHRSYSASQFDAAIRLKTLRTAGIPLAEAADLLGEGQAGAAVLAHHRVRLAAERERQDTALDTLEELLKGKGGGEWAVTERLAARQFWAGVLLRVPTDEEVLDEANEQTNEGFAALYRALAEIGNPPAGPFWSTIRAASGSGTEVELLCCWPVAAAVPADWSLPGWTIETGVIEADPELAVQWRFDDPAPVVDGVAHPAVLALLSAAEERGLDVDLSRVRQIGIMEQGESVGIEVAITLAS